MASDEGASLIEALTRSFEERGEDVRHWRVRCLQAEAEVRALKRGLRHADGDRASSSSASAALAVRARADAAPGDKLRDELQSLQATNEWLEARQAALGAGGAAQAHEELKELQAQLEQRDAALMQLQRDSLREKQQYEKQRRASESQNMRSFAREELCREELREMTQRAESLSEQVQRSRHLSSELQVARREVAKYQAECETTASRAAQFRGLRGADCQEAAEAAATAPSSVELPVSKARAQRTPSPRARSLSHYQQEVLHCVSSLHQLHGELERELRGAVHAPLVQRAVAGRLQSGAAALDKVMPRVNSQLERVWRLTMDAETASPASTALSPAMSSLASTASLGRASRGGNSPNRMGSLRTASWGRSQSPRTPVHSISSKEGDQPPPEACQQQQPQRPEVFELLKQQFNAHRIEAAEERERLLAEHCLEMDSLVRSTDGERRMLVEELADKTAAHARAEAEVSAAGMRRQVSEHFEGQASVLRKGVAAQLAGQQEMQRLQRNLDEHRLEKFQRQLRECKSELSVREEEFATLAGLFDRERRELTLLRRRCSGEPSPEEDLGESAGGYPVTPTAKAKGSAAPPLSQEELTPEATVAWTVDSTRGITAALQANAADFVSRVESPRSTKFVASMRTAMVPGVVRQHPLVHQRRPNPT